MPTLAPVLRRWLTREPAQGQTSRPSGAAAEANSARDPVCGMVIPIADAAATGQHAGRTVYFCAAGCKERFDRAPDTFPLD
ncbi:MAG: YHS domain-containing protein [Dehalococcoidia bacterium]|nr:YHS domain-containing protein [Dehalococcoidia bacterium]